MSEQEKAEQQKKKELYDPAPQCNSCNGECDSCVARYECPEIQLNNYLDGVYDEGDCDFDYEEDEE